MNDVIRPPRALTLKQELFIRHYLGQARGNATEACRLAGYEGSDTALRVMGTDNIRHPIISMRIKEHLIDVAVSADEVLSELAGVAMSPWIDHVIQIKDAQGNVVGARMDLKDKVKALELLGRYHKLFADRVEVSGPVMKALVGVNLDDL